MNNLDRFPEPEAEPPEELTWDERYRAWVRDIAAIARLHGRPIFTAVMAAGAEHEGEAMDWFNRGYGPSLAYLELLRLAT